MHHGTPNPARNLTQSPPVPYSDPDFPSITRGDPWKDISLHQSQHHGSPNPGLSLSLMARPEAKDLVVGENLTNAKSMTNMVRLRYSSVILVQSSPVHRTWTTLLVNASRHHRSPHQQNPANVNDAFLPTTHPTRRISTFFQRPLARSRKNMLSAYCSWQLVC